MTISFLAFNMVLIGVTRKSAFSFHRRFQMFLGTYSINQDSIAWVDSDTFVVQREVGLIEQLTKWTRAEMVKRDDVSEAKSLYYRPRNVGGVLCALSDYLMTTGLVVDITQDGCCQRRYCFERAEDAIASLVGYTDCATHPPGNWIKCKGTFEGKHVDLLNPNLT